MTWNDLGDIRKGHVAIFRFRVSGLPVNRCLRVFRIIFVQKRRLSIVSQLFIMEKSQHWPDFVSPISKFQCIHFLDAVTDINRWKFQGDRSFGVVMTSIQTFFLRWGHLTWPGDLTLSDLGLKFHNMCGKYAWTGVPETMACEKPITVL